MTATYAPTTESRLTRRPPWIVMVDAVLPVVLVFWTLVDRSASAIASFALSSPGIARSLH